jgi:diaminohydroxyphosphoribosylaminopyrimidine deaminase/5-amino-6-(5-phosphoribosylamino)uracil reductase
MSSETYMRMALEMAKLGEGWTSPNPMVGAVVVKDGEAVGSGYHAKAGQAHAEVNALAAAGVRARGATLYVTLEPCNHTGKTPPCTQAVLAAGVSRVVVAMEDPNPKVKGGGIEFLRSRGVEVETGVLEKEARELNAFWRKHVTTGRPFVLAKCAATLDGHIATRTGHSQWITNTLSRERAHLFRHTVDAVLVGIGTVHADDPALNVRLPNRPGRDPLRVVLDPMLSIHRDARLLHIESEAAALLVCAPGVPAEKRAELESLGAWVAVVPHGPDGRVDFPALLDYLGRMDITSLMIEGGGRVLGAALTARAVDKVALFYAPKLLGGSDGVPMFAGPGAERMDQTPRLRDVAVSRHGDDLLVEGYVVYPEGRS